MYLLFEVNPGNSEIKKSFINTKKTKSTLEDVDVAQRDTQNTEDNVSILLSLVSIN